MNTTRKLIATGALAASVLAGGALGASLVGVAGAQTADSSSTTAPAASSTDQQAPPQGAPHGPQGAPDPSKGGHQGKNGTEALLTGDDATKATDAALAAVPGGTIQRVETEMDGNGTYEAHMTDASGKQVTVLMDANFAVTEVAQGMK